MKKNSPIKAIALSLSCLLAFGGAYALGSGLLADKKAVEVSAADSTIEKVYTGDLGSFKTKTSYGNWSWSKAANNSDTRWNLTAGEEITFTYSHTDYIFHIATGIKDLYDNEDFVFWMTVGSGTTQYEDQGLYDQIAFSDLSRRVGRTDDVIIHVKNNATSTKTFTFNSRWDDDSQAYDLLFAVTKGHANFSLDNQGGTGITSVPLRRHSPCPTPIPTPTRQGYVFKGYFTQTGGKGTKYYDADGKIIQSVYNYTGDAGTVIPLYAYWEGASYTVTLNKNGGTGGSNSVSAKYGSNMPSMTKPTKTGYNFQGYWDTAESTGGTQYYNANGGSVRTWDKTSAATLYARWSAKTSTVSFNRNGGTGGSSSVTATYDEAMPVITVPTREYYEFLGYYNSSSGGVKYYNADGTSAKKWDKENSSVTLYAQWLALGTNITLDKQGGVNGTNEVLGVIGETLPNITLPARSGYNFNGYYSGQNGQGTQYYNSNGISSYVWTSSATSATFYASWTIKAAVQEVIDKIDDIGTVSYPGSGDKIDAARAAYNALDAADKGGVSNYSTLTSAESQYASLRQQGIADAEALVNALGTITLEKENDIVEARAAYEALTEEQKNKYDGDVLATLEEAEARLEELKANKAAADVVVAKINAIGEVSYPESGVKIDAARAAYDALENAEQEGFVSNYATLTSAESQYASLRQQGIADAEDLVLAIGEVTLEKGEQIKAARAAYEALTEEQKDSYKESILEALIAAEAEFKVLDDQDKANAVKALINAIGTVEYTTDCKDKIDAARTAYDELTTDQSALVDNYPTLVAAEEVYDNLDAANNVKELINAIGTVEYTEASKDKIDAAREGYDGLTDDQKTLVGEEELKKLTDSEAAYAILKADHEAANEVVAKIDAIGTVEYTDTCKGKIDAARTAYDALTDEQKALVENYSVLVDAEAAYAKLKADHEAADVVIAKINDIGEVALTDGCKAKIDAARTAYEALSEDQKELVTNKKVLFDAIELYDTLAHQPTVVDNGVKVEGKDGELIPVNVNVKVEVKTSVEAQEGTTEYKNIQEAVGNNQKIAGVYDIKLVRTVDGVETVIQPSDIKQGMIIIIEITLPDGLSVEGLKVLHIHSENDISFIENYTITGNVLSFETDRLSEVAFVVPVPQSGLPVGAIVGIIIGGLILLCCLFFLVMFLFFPVYYVDYTKREVRRAIKIKKHFDMVLMLNTRFQFVRRNEVDVYKTVEEANTALGSHN